MQKTREEIRKIYCGKRRFKNGKIVCLICGEELTRDVWSHSEWCLECVAKIQDRIRCLLDRKFTVVEISKIVIVNRHRIYSWFPETHTFACASAHREVKCYRDYYEEKYHIETPDEKRLRQLNFLKNKIK